MNKTLFALLSLAFIFQLSKESSVELGSDIFVTQAPTQTLLKAAPSFPYKEFMVTPLAEFNIQAKVLSYENYSFDEGSKISPTDLALGWQSMSKEDILKSIDISQSRRWYRWSVKNKKFPVSRRSIETQSANMHIIPADESVEKTLKSVRKGEIIELQGSLVEVRGENNWRWRSSLTRNDTGGNSCELFYVQSIKKVYYK
jgi:hypothetical protein